MPIRPVLIVEDDAAIATLVGAVLRYHGFEFELATDGEAAIRLLRTTAYAAVLLDLMLPRVNGFDVLQFLRAEKSDVLPTVIVMTAAADRTLQHFDRSSVGAFLRKPFDLGDLVAAVRACTASVDETPLPIASPEVLD